MVELMLELDRATREGKKQEELVCDLNRSLLEWKSGRYDVLVGMEREYKEKIWVLRGELESFKSDNVKLVSSIQNLEQRISKDEEEKNKVKKDLAMERSELGKQNEDIVRSWRRVDRVHDAAKEVERRLHDKTEEATNLKNENNNFKCQLEQAYTNAKETEQKHQQEVGELTDRMTATGVVNSIFARQLRQAHIDIKEIKQEFEQKASELTGRITSASSENSTLARQMKQASENAKKMPTNAE